MDKGANQLRAGVARSDITTESKDVMVHDRLYAKALALDDGETKLVIISMDAVAIGGICDVKDDFLPALRRRIHEELRIPGHHVLVHATHTHSPGELLCDDQQQVERTLDATRRALAEMTDVTIGVGRGFEDRILINRTLRLKNGKHWTIRMANPTPPDDEVESLGPVDPEIGILRLDRLDGRPLAVVYNYACHPLIGTPGGHASAMYPGVASRVIEEDLGHGAMALFLQGAAGDVTEVLYKDVSRPRDSEPIGMMLGWSTLKGLREIRARQAGARLKVVTEAVHFPRRTDIPQRVAALLREQGELLKTLRFTSLNIKSFVPLYLKYALSPEFPADYSYRYLCEQQIGSDDLCFMDKQNRRSLNKYMSNVLAMEKLARIQDEIETLEQHKKFNDDSGETMVRAEIQGIRIGEFVLIAAPFEPLAEIGLNLKKTSPHAHTFVAGFSNGYLHYAAPADYYERGGYEVTECMLGSKWQGIFETTVADILLRL